jgi:hypothetical protein
MNPRAGGADSEFLSADQLAVEAELQEYASRVSPLPSAAFVDRVVAAADQGSLPVAVLGPRVRATDSVHAAGRWLRVALAQVAGGPSIPLRARIQAGAMLLVVALLITAGAALAAAGASSVVTWVTEPQAPAAGSRPSPSPTLSPYQPSDAWQSGEDANGSSNPGKGGKPSQNPGNCGQSSQNPGNCGQSGQGASNSPSNHPNATGNPGNGVGPAKSPGSQASKAHPNATGNPGNGVGPAKSPGSQASNHPNATGNPGNGVGPAKSPGSQASKAHP